MSAGLGLRLWKRRNGWLCF